MVLFQKGDTVTLDQLSKDGFCHTYHMGVIDKNTVGAVDFYMKDRVSLMLDCRLPGVYEITQITRYK